ncbi:IclR family transcriptional regulator [Kribbella solani]|uniref:IclR family transcriptional regulator n=1 Tax=Kribbella solani TaxID=236067 RepID=UPI0029BF4336|nr:IclR family transcriptional regulator [Kribbella solani]MDX2969467.1 IclR family transcriptional regulator [Kribbella solani]MDX3001839.1 IclR family transcriptional regulator [Kribbella solani]
MPDVSSQGSGYRSRNSTADRALDILLLFDDDTLVLSGARVADHLQVARSTAYRYLQSLTSMGFLEENDGGGFRLGPRVLDLARLARKGVGLSDLAQPVMRELARTTGFPVLLTRRTGSAVVCLEREDANQALRLSYERGEILPLNAGAAALVLLAWAPDQVIDEVLDAPLPRFTEATITDPKQLRSRLAEIRDHEYVSSRAELDRDVLGIAAPVRGLGGEVVAAISVAALSHRISDEELPAVGQLVTKAAEQLSVQVGRMEIA